MPRKKKKGFLGHGQRGFTLIELLAVMAVIGVLTGIVVTSVSGTGEAGRDAQTREDAGTVGRSVGQFFADQLPADVLVQKTVTVLGIRAILQESSSRWPEGYISVAYPQVFPEDTSTVQNVLFLNTDGAPSDLTVRGLLTHFNAIDFPRLELGGYLAKAPDTATRTSQGYHNYLWLLQRTTSAADSAPDSSRAVAVFKLVSVLEAEASGQVALVYQRLVGEDFSDAHPTAIVKHVTTLEDISKAITLSGHDGDTCELAFVIDAGPIHGSLSSIINQLCSPGSPNTDTALVTYSPHLNFNGIDSFTYTVIDGNGDSVASVTVTINVVNDLPTVVTPIGNLSVNEDAANTVIDLSGTFDDVDIFTNDDLLSLSVSNSNPSLLTATLTNGSTLRLAYYPNQNGTALITVRATDLAGDSSEETFTVTVTPVNDPPVFDSIPAQAVNQTAGAQNVSITGVAPGPATATDEAGQTVTLVASSDNQALVPAPIITGTVATRTLSYTPAAGQSGTATITVTADDGQAANHTFSQTFTITVVPVVPVATGFSPTTFNWVEISQTGTRVFGGGASCDDCLSGPISLGFNMPYFGQSFNTIQVSTNGIVPLGGTGGADGCCGGYSIPSSSFNMPIIAPYWDDTYVYSYSNIYYQTLGTAPNRVAVVEWSAVGYYGLSGHRSTFEVLLHENGTIVFQYLVVDQPRYDRLSVGVQLNSSQGIAYLQPGAGNPPITNGLAISVRPQITVVPVPVVPGTITITFNAPTAGCLNCSSYTESGLTVQSDYPGGGHLHSGNQFPTTSLLNHDNGCCTDPYGFQMGSATFSAISFEIHTFGYLHVFRSSSGGVYSTSTDGTVTLPPSFQNITSFVWDVGGGGVGDPGFGEIDNLVVTP